MPYIGNNHPNWLIFFKGVQNTNQKVNLVMILVMSLVMILGPSNSFSWHHQHSRHSPATSCQHRRWGQGKQHLSFGFQRFSSKARAVAGAGPLKAWESYGIGFSLEEFNMSFRGLRLQCCFPTSVQLNSLGPLELTSLEVAETGRFVAVWLHGSNPESIVHVRYIRLNLRGDILSASGYQWLKRCMELQLWNKQTKYTYLCHLCIPLWKCQWHVWPL